MGPHTPPARSNLRATPDSRRNRFPKRVSSEALAVGNVIQAISLFPKGSHAQPPKPSAFSDIIPDRRFFFPLSLFLSLPPSRQNEMDYVCRQDSCT